MKPTRATLAGQYYFSRWNNPSATPNNAKAFSSGLVCSLAQLIAFVS